MQDFSPDNSLTRKLPRPDTRIPNDFYTESKHRIAPFSGDGMKLTCMLLLTAAMLGCGYGSNYNGMGSGAAPSISQLMPNSVAAGGSGFVLTVNGTNFGTGSVVYWNSVAHNATYLTGQQVTTAISASDVAMAGTIQVYVRSNNQNSNTMTFNIQ